MIKVRCLHLCSKNCTKEIENYFVLSKLLFYSIFVTIILNKIYKTLFVTKSNRKSIHRHESNRNFFTELGSITDNY